MRAGALRERITLQITTQTVGPAGGLINSWVDQTTVWARIEPTDSEGSEKPDAQRQINRFKITIRRRDVSATKNRILWGSRVLSILGANDAERKNDTIITCEEGGPSGG
jgi:SPP1 family predicted phage head-tail adaptor